MSEVLEVGDGSGESRVEVVVADVEGAEVAEVEEGGGEVAGEGVGAEVEEGEGGV